MRGTSLVGVLGALALFLVGGLALTAPSGAQETGGRIGGSDDDWGAPSSGHSAHPSRGSSDETSGSRAPDDRASRTPDRGASDRNRASTSSDQAPSSGEPVPWRPDRWALARVDRGRPNVLETESAALARPPRRRVEVFTGIWLCVFALVFVLRVRSLWRPRPAVTDGPWPRFSRRPAAPAPPSASATITRLSVAYGPRARAHIQRMLIEIAESANLRSRPARHATAHRVAVVMHEHASDACYAALWSSRMTPSEGPGALARISQELRARYRADTVGQVRSAAPPGLVARPEDGPGLVVVSLVIGSKSDGAPPLVPRTTAEIPAALAALIPRADDLVGLELIWSPSEEADRLSSYELEALYPELERLVDAGAVGAVRCDACGGGFSRELRFCPHCGRPV